MSDGSRVIAIDGPAASGKSSTAAAVARALGAYHLDSGALYRGLTRVALDLGSRDPEAIARGAERRGLRLVVDDRDIVPSLDGRPAETLIRSAEVTAAVSDIAALGSLRDWVNQRLRAAAGPERVLVLDGRDIGSDVFPDARLKVFLTATPLARARRRLAQRGEDDQDPTTIEREARALAARDALDSSRAIAPLRQAPDATRLDTSDLSFEEQVARILTLARGLQPPLA